MKHIVQIYLGFVAIAGFALTEVTPAGWFIVAGAGIAVIVVNALFQAGTDDTDQDQ